MFKKPVKVSAQNQLSGKDKKVIKSKASQALDSDCVQKILTSNQKIICCKIQGSKMLIYNGEDYPLFVDGTGKNNYFPSLYVAMAYQPLIKTLDINQGVETYIYNGANLMWPGVRSYEGLGEWTKDQTAGIRNSKGEIIAIGAMGCSKKDMTADTSGVAVYILHYLGDKLWEMGTKNVPEVIVPLKVQIKKEQVKQETKLQQPATKTQQPKKQQKAKKQPTKETGKAKQKEKSPEKKKQKSPEQSQESSDDDFMNLVHDKNQTKGRVIKMQQKPSAKMAFVEDQNQQKNTKNKKKNQPPAQGKKGGKNKKQESQEDVMEEEQQEPQQKKSNKKGGKKKGGKQQKKEEKKQKGKKKQQSQDQDEQGEKKQEKSEDQQKQQKGEQKSAINSKLMDEYFIQSFLNAIKLSKIDQQLPIDSGRFFMDYMLLARPQGVKLEIKQSSYKKIGKFFEQMAKKKIIEYKHPKDKKAQGAQITKIFWENEDLKNHVPTIKKLGAKEEQQKVESYSKAKLKLSKTAVLQTVYKPQQDLFNEMLKKPLNLMPAEGEVQVTDKQQIDFITEKQLREKIERYINKIVDGSKDKQKQKEVKKVEKTVLINYSKHAFLRELLKKEIEQYEDNKEHEEILKAEEGSDDQDEKKKKKAKKGPIKELLKIDRNYLTEKLMKKASPHYHVYDQTTGLDIFKQGTFKGIQLIAEKVANKNVTRIIGLEMFIIPKSEADDQIHGFANTLQTKFACSVNIHNLPGKNAGKEIIVHGAFLDELEEMFTVEHELPNKFISTLNKLDKKKKNN